ncbi:MAG: DUF2442 domain-containing protein [bacterium]
MPWRVTSAAALPGSRLHVTFVDGTTGEVELDRFLHRPDIGEGVFAPLRDPEVFSQARVVRGAVEWPGGPDLAPDAMYDAIREHGRWVVE